MPNAANPAQEFAPRSSRERTIGTIVRIDYSMRRTDNKPLKPRDYAKNGKNRTNTSSRYTVHAPSKSTERRRVTIQKVEPVRNAAPLFPIEDITPRNASVAQHPRPENAKNARRSFPTEGPEQNSVTMNASNAISSRGSCRDTPRNVKSAIRKSSTLNSECTLNSDAQSARFVKQVPPVNITKPCPSRSGKEGAAFKAIVREIKKPIYLQRKRRC